MLIQKLGIVNKIDLVEYRPINLLEGLDLELMWVAVAGIMKPGPWTTQPGIVIRKIPFGSFFSFVLHDSRRNVIVYSVIKI